MISLSTDREETINIIIHYTNTLIHLHFCVAKTLIRNLQTASQLALGGLTKTEKKYNRNTTLFSTSSQLVDWDKFSSTNTSTAQISVQSFFQSISHSYLYLPQNSLPSWFLSQVTTAYTFVHVYWKINKDQSWDLILNNSN